VRQHGDELHRDRGLPPHVVLDQQVQRQPGRNHGAAEVDREDGRLLAPEHRHAVAHAEHHDLVDAQCFPSAQPGDRDVHESARTSDSQISEDSAPA